MSGFDSEGRPALFQLDKDHSHSTVGIDICIQLNEYAVPIYFFDNVGYIPLQLYNDTVIGWYGRNYLYNGEAVFQVSDAMPAAMSEPFYSFVPRARSQALATFTYNEFTLMLDFNYGLKTRHGITGSFDSYLDSIGLKDDLCSTDPVVADKAVNRLVFGELADFHSKYRSNSAYAGKDAVTHEATKDATSYSQVANRMDEVFAARAASSLKGAPASYQKVGYTAYVTFDSFAMANDYSYYDTPATESAEDTIGIIE
jgi:hypothetical protein